MATVTKCPHCGSGEIYHKREVYANWSDFQLLPRIFTGFLNTSPGKFDVHVCADCGHTMFFVQEEFLEKVREKWTKA